MFWTPRFGELDRSPFGRFWFEPIGMRSEAGMRVTADTAMRLGAVYACVNLLAKSFAMLPFELYRPRANNKGRDLITDHWLYRLFEQRPNEFQNPFEWRQMCMGHLALRGNCFNEIFDDGAGQITDLIPLHPDRVKPDYLNNGSYRYRVKSIDGTERVLPRGKIWHLRWLSSDGVVGISPIDYARETIGIGLAAQQYGARFFLNDARPGGGWIEHPGQFKDKTARQNFRDQVQKAQAGENRHKTMVLEGGMKYHEVGINNEQAQFLETRKFSVADIARIFGCPPHLVGDLEKATFSNIEQQSLEYVTYTMMPINKGWQSSAEYSLLEDDSGLKTDFDVSYLLRGDQAARGQFYSQLFALGALSTNDIRIREGDDPVPSGDKRFRPANLVPLEQEAADPGQPSGPVDDDPGKDPGQRRKPLNTERFAVLAQAAAARILRKESETTKGGKQLELDKHAQFIADVLGISIESAFRYCAQRARMTGDQAIAALLALAFGEELTDA